MNHYTPPYFHSSLFLHNVGVVIFQVSTMARTSTAKPKYSEQGTRRAMARMSARKRPRTEVVIKCHVRNQSSMVRGVDQILSTMSMPKKKRCSLYYGKKRSTTLQKKCAYLRSFVGDKRVLNKRIPKKSEQVTLVVEKKNKLETLTMNPSFLSTIGILHTILCKP